MIRYEVSPLLIQLCAAGLVSVSPPFVLQVDFPVEATLQLSAGADQAEVLETLRSYGFVLEGPTSDHVRVKGSFLNLKRVKASLEMLLKSPAKAGVTPSPSSSPEMSSGAISKHHTDLSDAKRGPLESQKRRASPSAPISSSLEDFRESPDQAGSVRTGWACSSIVDSDVFDYANCLRRTDMNAILVSHHVGMRVKAVDDYYVITLSGKSAKVCMTKLKTLLDNLHKSLRTQEVPLKDLTPEGRRLAARIKESRNIYKSVLVQKRNSRLHLIGPSGESYQLQQTLLGRTGEQPQPGGRGPDRKATRRSSSLPPTNHKTEDGAGAAPSPPGRYQGSRQEAAEARRRLGGPVVT